MEWNGVWVGPETLPRAHACTAVRATVSPDGTARGTIGFNDGEPGRSGSGLVTAAQAEEADQAETGQGHGVA